jgi:hypothetical protein
VTGLFLDISTARLLLLDPDAGSFVALTDDHLPGDLAAPGPVGHG